ncbi:Protein-N(5)-glutamine methyltransferase PrmC, methylates polypeptide chain release factors RF1 and RF2 [Winogradskyella psychrotolerans RS-3]|uniref:Protein-N(5)-glutamine methyltransferase PrmC, methylates polypeptide chain release factors RF1 and RF2 n=1 Tax=Winogradskyella psychrotolerans RS-3 TaxID=641526 RepID=S7X769_9FLAO|nr:Rossmann-like fold-containing protein [Winogradskyella psychrotolerans]EPR74914.1 Protein-N(5)-glutamine methyltransferase PrmC, methylates polypeptide chain release factors RF1 and RF2 [Winogradskyella psychrotolerans RS-3]
MTDLKVNKPEPFLPLKDVTIYNRGEDIKSIIKVLEAGNPVLITEFYNNGSVLLKGLQEHLNKKLPNKSFKEQRAYRAEYHKLSNLILLEIENHQILVKKAPAIGWFEKLYPETSDFLLTLPQVQGLNSAWQWYTNGITIPVLRNKIHPYYGTYFPTRFEHLELFDNWLKRYSGPKKSAIDVGVGSGILALQMIKHGFQKVFATDTNPNAIIGLTEMMGDTKLSRKIELDFGSLFGKWKNKTELIVFNPPWLAETRDLNNLDEAIYYNDTLFSDFFEAAKEMLLPDGKLVLIFSNLAQISGVAKSNPIEQEIAEGGRFQLEKCFKKNVKKDLKKQSVTHSIVKVKK